MRRLDLLKKTLIGSVFIYNINERYVVKNIKYTHRLEGVWIDIHISRKFKSILDPLTRKYIHRQISTISKIIGVNAISIIIN